MDEEGIAGDYFERFDSSFGGDERVKFHASFALNLSGEGRIAGLDSTDELGHLRGFADCTANYGRLVFASRRIGT